MDDLNSAYSYWSNGYITHKIKLGNKCVSFHINIMNSNSGRGCKKEILYKYTTLGMDNLSKI